MQDLHDHFKSVLNNAPKNVAESKLRALEEKVNEFTKSKLPPDNLATPGGYSPDIVEKVVKTLKNGKSSFSDGSINEVIKNSISSTSSILSKLFNHIEMHAF